MYHKTTGYRVFSYFNYAFMILAGLACFLPLLHLLAQSLSSKAAISGNMVSFWPVGFNVDAYVKTFNNSNFNGAMLTSITRTVLGTTISMFILTCAGYALSKEFRGRNVLMWFLSLPCSSRGIDTFLHIDHSPWIKGYHMGSCVTGRFRCL